MLANGPYQLLDPLSPEDFAALEADILERGVLVAIEFDEDGYVLDGHHRLLICEKHGITDYPTVIRRGWSEEQKRSHARRMNLARRQLTRDQRRKLIEAELRECPESSNRKIGTALGVDHKTVGTVRKSLESGGEIPQVAATIGSDGKPYKRTSTRRSPAPEKEIPIDADGNEVVGTLADVFRAVPEFRSLWNELLGIKRRLLALGEVVPAMEVQDRQVKRLIEQLQDLIAGNVPHAIHPDCDGAGCDDCGGRGYTTGGEIPQVEETGE